MKSKQVTKLECLFLKAFEDEKGALKIYWVALQIYWLLSITLH